ncbi:hypothetical protein FLONG3_10849 [Fusarium longipes]|uniref:Uncharacterized protein n=1 Tax=Fusarium longipes TaxID=694270 RepID=A0A395RK06_9HYPO|nr:hypothetical protein FLONG3_10849 [Fusarium longipes]
MASQSSAPTSPQSHLNHSTLSNGPQMIEVMYLMTRERAMMQAGDLAQKLGHRGADQSSLTAQMNQWLSVPVIKVLSDDMKDKTFIWCQQYNPGWLDTIRAAEDDILEYRYSLSVEDSNTTRMDLGGSWEKDFDAFKQEVLKEYREVTAAIMAKIDAIQPSGLNSAAAHPTKRQRTSPRNNSKKATIENMVKVDEGLCHLLGEESDLVQCFRHHAASVDSSFSVARVESNRKPSWSKGQLENFRKQAQELGLSVLEYKLLDRTIQEMSEADLSMENIAALARLITSTDQYANLEAKFPFPFLCDQE